MADLADVEAQLVSLITQAIYPNGTSQASAIGVDIRVYRGWPVPDNLDTDLTAGKVNISVFPLDIERNVTRYPRDWQQLPLPAASLTLTVAGQTITVGGTPSSPLNVAVLVNGTAYVYPVQPGDTTTSIATALAALIPGASNSGPVITVPGAITLIGRVGVIGSIIKEIRRQVRSFRITFWCPNPTIRDAVAAVVDPALAALEFIALPDGTAGRIIYERTHVDDVPEKAILYRRDLVYSVEYATTVTQGAAQIVSEIINVSGGIAPVVSGDNTPITTINV